jgi:hypothetical protein
MPTDRYGLALTTASPEAAAAYRDGVDLILSAYVGAEARLRAAIAHDENFALAYAALARQLQIYSRVPEARQAIARARTLVEAASARERGHVHVLGLVIDGQPGKALDALLPHLDAFPRDVLPLSLALGAFGLYAFSGRADHDAARLALCRKLAPHYGDDWWFLTHLGWSHTEAGDLAAGVRITQRALELRRENAHAAHALAHFFSEADEGEAGTEFVENWLPGYDRGATLYAHLSWHRALWRLKAHDVEGALALYTEALRPGTNQAPPVNVISDAASLLWRIRLREEKEVDWGEVHAYGKARFPLPGAHFVEWHLAMAAAGAGELEALDQRLATWGDPPPGPVLRSVCAAFKSFAECDYQATVGLLEPMVSQFVRLGGSGAQRAVLQETLQAARQRANLGARI